MTPTESLQQLAQQQGFNNTNGSATQPNYIGLVFVLFILVVLCIIVFKAILPAFARYTGNLGKEFKKGIKENSFCNKCGAGVLPESAFCGKCGSKL